MILESFKSSFESVPLAYTNESSLTLEFLVDYSLRAVYVTFRSSIVHERTSQDHQQKQFCEDRPHLKDMK